MVSYQRMSLIGPTRSIGDRLLCGPLLVLVEHSLNLAGVVCSHQGKHRKDAGFLGRQRVRRDKTEFVVPVLDAARNHTVPDPARADDDNTFLSRISADSIPVSTVVPSTAPISCAVTRNRSPDFRTLPSIMLIAPSVR